MTLVPGTTLSPGGQMTKFPTQPGVLLDFYGNPVAGTPVGGYVVPLAENASQILPPRLPFYNVKDYGATGDGVTDDTTAVQAALNACAATGGVVIAPTGVYLISAALSITASNMGLWGMGIGATIFNTNSPSIDFLDIAGAGGGSYVAWNSVRDLSFARGVTPTTGIGIKATWTTRLLLENLEIADSLYCFYFQNTAGNLVSNCECTQARGTSGSRYGYYIDGSSGQNQSIRLVQCEATMQGATGAGVTTYAYYLEGPSIQDARLRECETSGPTYGLYINASNVTNFDVHIADFVCDAFTNTGIYITGAGTDAMISILDGWTNPKAGGSGTTNIYVNSSRGVIIQGHQFFCDTPGAGGNALGAHINASENVTLGGNMFDDFYNAISFTSATLSTISHNLVYNLSAHPAQYAMTFDAGCSRISIVGNVIDGDAAGSYTNGINLANGADYFWITGNTINPGVLTTAVNLGTATHSFDSQSRTSVFSSSGSVTASPPALPGPVACTVVGHYSVTTSAGGAATVTFPTAFPNGLLTALGIVESSAAGNYATCQLVPGSSDRTQATFLCAIGGVPINAGAIFIDVVAYGW